MAAKKIDSIDASKNFNKLADEVIDNQEALIINRPNKQNVVLISEQEYRFWQENLYVLGNSTNRKYLEESLQQLKNNQIKTFSMEEWKKLTDEE
ncbi:type II toxin-antitoxin system Phd/YefM family antitoxin [Companilactobacillus kimchiensis]|uniref:Antitoxin n=1 Tax=Companilactobacillus kimchiensis TaxID=993692 RepID=A0A0R2LF86_9LACO|nr:type II toxin-antitoxin system Phd/YefM family antitoxin [Companilactobacillus kimchiensis]KRO00568.1 hypothetical protein IV57_GL001004 [Companilactobacillus kimchiensis]